MSHSGRRALAETAATLSGGGSYKQHGKDNKKKTTKKPGVKPKPTTTSANKRGGGGGYGHGHKQKGGNCDGTYEFTQEQANVLFLASDTDPNLKDLNENIMNAIFESLKTPSANSTERKVSIKLTNPEKASLLSIVFLKKNQNLASIVQEIKSINARNAARNAANKTSIMNQLEIRLNRYNFMKNLKDENLQQLKNQLIGLRTELKKQDEKCSKKTTTSAQAAAKPPNPGTNGGQKSSFLTKR